MDLRRLALAAPFVLTVSIAVACGSDDSDSGLASPGDACDGSRPLVCGSLSKGGSRRDVVLLCKGGVYESVMDCKPTGNGLTNRCFGGGNSTVTDCFDEPSAGSVTRCEVSGSGTSTSHSCSVGRR